MNLDYRKAKGWLRPEEREYLRYIAGQVGQGIIVNIGTEHGASLVCLRAGSPTANIVGIDLDNSKAPHDLSVFWVQSDSGEYYPIAKQWIVSAHILFVDGDHTYEGVKRDIKYTELVGLGGYAIFHDCYDYANPYDANNSPVIHKVVPGVNKAVREWSKDNNCWAEQGPVGTMRIFKRLTCG